MISTKRFFFLLIFLITLLIVYVYRNANVCPKTGCFTMKDLDKFQVKEVYEDNNTVYRALLTNNNDTVRIEKKSGLTSNKAEKSIQAQITRMKALFENATSPYPGEISDEIVCGDEFKPIFSENNQNGLKISYFTGYLNNRLVFGACTKDQAVYKGNLVLFYCPDKKQLFQLEIIAPKDVYLASEGKYQQMIDSLSCST